MSFKVGDRIIGVPGSPACLRGRPLTGTVVRIYARERRDLIHVQRDDIKTPRTYHISFWRLDDEPAPEGT